MKTSIEALRDLKYMSASGVDLPYLFVQCGFQINALYYMVQHHYTVKPPKRDCTGDKMFGPCREVGSISEVFLQIHCNPPHNDRA